MKEPVAERVTIDIEGMDFARVEAKTMANVGRAIRGGGKTQYMKQLVHTSNYGTVAAQMGNLIHDELYHTGQFWTRPASKSKTKQPWQKGFIPTVGKKPELPAPVISGWKVIDREGNNVTYEKSSADPFSYQKLRIKGDLVKRQWVVEQFDRRKVYPDQYDTVMTAPNYAACVVFAALEDEPEPGLTDAYGWASFSRYMKP